MVGDRINTIKAGEKKKKKSNIKMKIQQEEKHPKRALVHERHSLDLRHKRRRHGKWLSTPELRHEKERLEW